MARSCCVINCHSRSHDSHGKPKAKGIGFYRIPAWNKNYARDVSEVTKRQRMAWIAAIGRPNITFQNTPPHMLVCSKHFLKGKPAYKMMESDPDWAPSIHLGHTELKAATTAKCDGRARSKQPPQVSHSSGPETDNPGESHAGNPASGEQPMEYNSALDHDYFCDPEPACLDVTVEKNMKLKEEMGTLRKEIQELKMQSAFGLQRFAGSDDDIQFYTGFASYRHFMMFWGLIEPSVHKVIYRSRSEATERRSEAVNASHTRQSLQPIDELFLFQMCLAAGLEERDLADRFGIHPLTVSGIISSWTNYLYTLLGSVCIWIDAEDIKAHLPDDFKDFPDTQGSISDEELFRRSGLADLLTEDMAIVVDEGFLMSDCVDWKVYCPAFLSQNSQMLAHSGFQRQEIERLSAHVESVIRRVKENKLLDSVIPLSISGSIKEIFTVACLLINYQNKPLVKARAK
uniref:THAP-type domain-containing protein n=1 Tax=Astatotilapia calliptera TaxID=8154 RepID=A0AAX7T9T8_ASTCA